MAGFMNVDPNELRNTLQEYMDSLESFEDKMQFALELHSMRKSDKTGEINVLPGIEEAIADVEKSIFYRQMPNGGVDEDYTRQAIHEFNKNMIAMQIESSKLLQKNDHAISLDNQYKMQDVYEIFEEFREDMISKDQIKEMRLDDYHAQIDELSDKDLDDYRKYHFARKDAMKASLVEDTAKIDMDARDIDGDKAYKFITEELLAGKAEIKSNKAEPVHEYSEPIVTEESTMSEEEKKANRILDALQSYNSRLWDVSSTATDMLEEYNKMKAAKSDNSAEFIKLGEALEAVSKLKSKNTPEEIDEALGNLKEAAEKYNERIDSSMFRGVLGAGRERRSFSGRLAAFAEEGEVSLNAVYPKDLARYATIDAQTQGAYNRLLKSGNEKKEPVKNEPEKKEQIRDTEKSRKTDLKEMKAKEDAEKGDASKGRKRMDPKVKKEIAEKHQEITGKQGENKKSGPVSAK